MLRSGRFSLGRDRVSVQRVHAALSTTSAEALRYGYGICRKVEQGSNYAQLVAEVKADIQTVDEFQASYLIGQAANAALCPNLTWQLRNSAANYMPASSVEVSDG